jgi:hypothetical protein
VQDTKGRRVKEYRFDALLISYETMLKEQNKLRRCADGLLMRKHDEML